MDRVKLDLGLLDLDGYLHLVVGLCHGLDNGEYYVKMEAAKITFLHSLGSSRVVETYKLYLNEHS